LSEAVRIDPRQILKVPIPKVWLRAPRLSTRLTYPTLRCSPTTTCHPRGCLQHSRI